MTCHRHGRRKPLSEFTLGGIKAVLELYDRRHVSLPDAIDEIITLVDRDRTNPR